ncbi:MAG: dihydrofolate reductase family protein [Bacteroidota bacterium]|jgi:dihydrofolate reductase
MTAERKVTFALNLTLDGYTDHTIAIADAELHDFFTKELGKIDMLLFGRVTYQLMESYWPDAENDPEATQSEKDFARTYNAIPKIVFSKTLERAEWKNSRIERGGVVETVANLKKLPGKNISVDSISLFQELARHNMIDEFCLLVHPLICQKGKRLFDGVDTNINLALVETQTFASGVVVLRYRKKI